MDTSISHHLRLRRLCFGVLSLFAMLAIAFPTTGVSYAEAASPFVGNWRATDPADGSDIRLAIGGPPTGPFQITWTESYIGFCSGEAGIVRGMGWLDPDDENRLQASLRVECFASGNYVDVEWEWRYHQFSDTLSTVEGNGVVTVWTRPGHVQDQPAALGLRVNYGADDWVESFYEAGHTAWITLTDGDANVLATTELITESKWYWDGGTGFSSLDSTWLDPEGNPMEYAPDIQPMFWVYGWMDNGASAQVQIGDISGVIDLAADSIAGTIFAPWFTDPVWVECLDWGSGGTPFPGRDAGEIQPTGNDSYSCSWAGEWDIQAGQMVGVAYTGPDGQWVANSFVVPNPNFVAYLPSAIEGYDWPMGSLVTVNINNGEYVEAATSEQREGAPPGATRVLFKLWEYPFAMEPGDYITMTDGVTTKDTIVTNLAVTSIDLPTKTVSGTYDPAYSLEVWLYGEDAQVPQRNEDGTWSAVFAELPLGALGGATQWEMGEGADGDGTSTDFQVPAPYLIAFPAYESIDAYGWPEGSEVHLSINEPPVVDQTAIVSPAPWNPDDIRAPFWFGDLYDLVPGDVVTLSGSGMDVTYTVHDVAIGNIDAEANTVAGTVEPGAEVYAWIHGVEGSQLQPPVEAGAWLADFGAAGFDLVVGMCGRAEIRDGFGNSTAADWCIEEPPAPELWIAAYTSDPMTWSPGVHSYYLESSYTFPASGGEITPLMEFTVSEGAPPYPGTVLLRPLALREFGDGSCPAIEDRQIRPDQTTRFLYGWMTEYPMTYAEAAAHFDSVTVTAYPDGGAGIELVRQELLQFDSIDWGAYVCSFAQ